MPEGKCPACGSDQLAYDNAEYEGNYWYQKFQCQDCRAAGHERFDYAGSFLHNDEGKVVEAPARLDIYGTGAKCFKVTARQRNTSVARYELTFLLRADDLRDLHGIVENMWHEGEIDFDLVWDDAVDQGGIEIESCEEVIGGR